MVADSALWQCIRGSGVQSLAVVGMTKNTGKTVTLNHLLACAHHGGLPVGLTSIGRDGEAYDAVFAVPKPPVRVWPGALVATATDTLARARLRLHTVAATGIASAMGEIVLVRALEAGEMEVAGASRNADLRALIAALQAQGCALVLLDGALGRSHHATPALTEGMVLASGAALGGTAVDVARKTAERLALLEIPVAPAPLRARCAALFADTGVGLWDAQDVPLFQAPISTLNAAATLMQHAHAAIKTVALGGAVGARCWAAVLALARSSPGLDVVVRDGTRLFVEAADLRALQPCGARLWAWQGIRVLGLSVNPHAPLGADLDADALLQAMRHALPQHAVVDVLRTPATARPLPLVETP